VSGRGKDIVRAAVLTAQRRVRPQDAATVGRSATCQVCSTDTDSGAGLTCLNGGRFKTCLSTGP
jgi:hypothetical protein